MSSVGAVARRFAWVILGLVLIVAGLVVGEAYGAPAPATAAEKVNAWTVKGGLKAYTFGFPVNEDKLGDCLDGSEGQHLSVLCAWPLLLEGQTFRGGVVLMGHRVPGEVSPVLTNIVLVDSGTARCDRLRTVAAGWRAVHRSAAHGMDVPGDDKHELAWWEGTTAITFKRGPVGEDRLGMHRRFRPEAKAEDVECRLAVMDMPSFQLSRSGL